MKMKYFCEITSVGSKPDKDGNYKLKVNVVDSYALSKIKAKKIITVTEQEIHKFIKGDCYEFQVEHTPETNVCINAEFKL